MPERRRVRAITAGLVIALLVAVFSVEYTVKSGDTLGRIARDHGVSLSELISANDIIDPDLIRPGQVLVIPGEDGEADVVHVVTSGETLTRIASKYGTTVSALVTANDLSNPNLIRIGQKLVVPAGSGSGQSGQDPNVRSGRYHVVRAGESLASIAAQYPGVTADQLAAANGIVAGVIYSGTRLFLDGPTFIGKGTGGEVSYVVERGDRLGDIAHDHGVSVSAIIDVNDIANPNLIRSGQTLRIPTGSLWVCPVAGATFFNDWGFPRTGGRFHEGNDLYATRGTPVRAPVSGTVEFKTGSIGGRQFNLQGSDGIMYLGSHLDSFGKSGQVLAGEVVGFVGNSGNADGIRPHLHFGMYHKGGVINPYPTLIQNGC
ncbi:MAG: LysM peptidoglycan-binding domain-containing M23 family metallopeptidase [Actinobacteria bacterium]|nr:LysM peptidoglycan-binding domain-containing M23 family metallopeptidase [Actinomycetota bacterium]MCI0544892.1 LysM peptidoglycan-binding domain-containing M23 family metallopeptidase [Actinomycetota bacterium]